MAYSLVFDNTGAVGHTSLIRRSGVVDTGGRTIQERFWKYTEVPIETDACWLWTGTRDRYGYGRIHIAGGRNFGAHRVAYGLLVGPIPAGMCVCHRCDNPGCVNPRHLFVASQEDNMRDMIRKGRTALCGVRGVDHWRAKFSPEEINELRRLVASGMSQAEAGRLFHMSHTNVSNVVHRRTWKNL